jgi:hypothetical protein
VCSREKFTDSGGTYENKAYQEAKEKQYLFHRSRRLCGNLHLQHWLQKRLTEFAVKYPAECRQLDDDGNGCKAFAVKKAVLASAWRHLTVKRDGKLPASWRRRTHRI